MPFIETAALRRMHQPGIPAVAARDANAVLRNGRLIGTNPAQKQTASFFRGIWNWVRARVGSKRALSVRPSVIASSPGKIAGDAFAVVAKVLRMDAFAPGDKARLRAAYCDTFQLHPGFAPAGGNPAGAAVASGNARKHRDIYEAHRLAISTIQPEFTAEMRDLLKQVDPEICKRFHIAAADINAAKDAVSNTSGGVRPTPRARTMFEAFKTYEHKVRTEILSVKALFPVFVAKPSEIKSLQRQYAADVLARFSHNFENAHPADRENDTRNVILQAYQAAIDAIHAIDHLDYPRGYPDTMKGPSQAVVSGMKHDIDCWSPPNAAGGAKGRPAPIDAARPQHLRANASAPDYKAVRELTEKLFPVHLEKYERSIRNLTYERVWPEESICSLKETYLSDFEERCRRDPADDRKPHASIWDAHNEALEACLVAAAGVALSHGEVHRDELTDYQDGLRVMLAHMNLEIRLEAEAMPQTPQTQPNASFSREEMAELNNILSLEGCKDIYAAHIKQARTARSKTLPPAMRKSVEKHNAVYDRRCEALRDAFLKQPEKDAPASIATKYWLATVKAHRAAYGELKAKLPAAYLAWMQPIAEHVGGKLAEALQVSDETRPSSILGRATAPYRNLNS